jgi:hypothetical protein
MYIYFSQLYVCISVGVPFRVPDSFFRKKENIDMRCHYFDIVNHYEMRFGIIAPV